MKNTLKVVFLGIIGFSLLVYLTAPKNVNNDLIKNVNSNDLNVNFLPRYFEVVGSSPYTKFETLFPKGKEKYLVVLNHDALGVFKELYKYTNENILLIANVSNTPWLIKQLAVNGKLEELYQNSTIPLVNDTNGAFINSLAFKNSMQNGYFIYKLNSDGSIIKVTEGKVKMGALENPLSNEELETTLKDISKLF